MTANRKRTGGAGSGDGARLTQGSRTQKAHQGHAGQNQAGMKPYPPSGKDAVGASVPVRPVGGKPHRGGSAAGARHNARGR